MGMFQIDVLVNGWMKALRRPSLVRVKFTPLVTEPDATSTEASVEEV
jgi:hypothetical protein